jgi:hypothetical protein
MNCEQCQPTLRNETEAFRGLASEFGCRLKDKRRRHVEDFFFADLDLTVADRNRRNHRSLFSHREFAKHLAEAAAQASS